MRANHDAVVVTVHGHDPVWSQRQAEQGQADELLIGDPATHPQVDHAIPVPGLPFIERSLELSGDRVVVGRCPRAVDDRSARDQDEPFLRFLPELPHKSVVGRKAEIAVFGEAKIIEPHLRRHVRLGLDVAPYHVACVPVDGEHHVGLQRKIQSLAGFGLIFEESRQALDGHQAQQRPYADRNHAAHPCDRTSIGHYCPCPKTPQTRIVPNGLPPEAVPVGESQSGRLGQPAG